LVPPNKVGGIFLARIGDVSLLPFGGHDRFDADPEAYAWDISGDLTRDDPHAFGDTWHCISKHVDLTEGVIGEPYQDLLTNYLEWVFHPNLPSRGGATSPARGQSYHKGFRAA